MIQPGKYNTLKVLRDAGFGLYLGDESGADVLLPGKYATPEMKIDSEVEVFIYHDSEERLIATTLKPKVCLNEFGLLKVNSVDQVGAWLEWGVEKDLLLPFSSQSEEVQEGKSYLVYLYMDEVTGRLVTSAKINYFLEKEDIPFNPGDEVSLLAWKWIEPGLKVIINQKYTGLVFRNQIFRDIRPGDKLTGYVKGVREDNKIDLALEPQGHKNIEPNAEKVLRALVKAGGYLDLHDKSNPGEITRRMEMSKKSYKKAIGSLFKQEIISLGEDGIYLNDEEE